MATKKTETASEPWGPTDEEPQPVPDVVEEQPVPPITVTVSDGTQINHDGTVFPAGATITTTNHEAATLWVQAGWATASEAGH